VFLWTWGYSSCLHLCIFFSKAPEISWSSLSLGSHNHNGPWNFGAEACKMDWHVSSQPHHWLALYVPMYVLYFIILASSASRLPASLSACFLFVVTERRKSSPPLWSLPNYRARIWRITWWHHPNTNSKFRLLWNINRLSKTGGTGTIAYLVWRNFS
jgi:hypothetical protein